MAIAIDTRQLDSLILGIANVRRELEHGSVEAMNRVKAGQIKHWRDNFRDEGARYGKWGPLSESTLKDRARRGFPPRPILVRRGTLLAWVDTHNAAGRAAAQSLHWEFHGVSGGADGASAVFHDLGFYNVAAKVYVPPRKIWDVNSADLDDAANELTRWVDDVINTNL